MHYSPTASKHSADNRKDPMQRLFRTHWQALCLMIMLAVVLTAVQGCAALGVPPADTFNKQLAVSVAINTEIRGTATTLLQLGKISRADAENVLAQTDVAREGLNVARSLSGTDLTSATGRLEATTAALRALQAYLIAKQGASK